MKQEHVLVIGLGISGRSAAQFLKNQGFKVTGVDRNPATFNSVSGIETKSESDPIDVRKFDFVVISPGIPPENPLYQAALAANIEVIGEIELACRYLKQTFLAITGTNGKTTTTLLVEHVLKHNGIKARALGNIGVPLTSCMESESKVLVVELSSYQIETLRTPCIDLGVILNISPDHLDRYSSMEEYAKAKIKLKECLKPQGRLFVEEHAFQNFRPLFDSAPLHTYGYSPHCEIFTDTKCVFNKGHLAFALPSHVQGRPSHNVENIMAAFALCSEMGVSPQGFLEGYHSFKTPPHRIEFIEMINGISYYNDSKGTNIDAVMRAVESLPGKIVLIAGGVDKGASYVPWLNIFTEKVVHICAIGQAATKIKKELECEIPVDCFASLEDAVKYASEAAKPEGVVLLSPGCSSFDMFRDYAHRGDEFKRIVGALNPKLG